MIYYQSFYFISVTFCVIRVIFSRILGKCWLVEEKVDDKSGTSVQNYFLIQSQDKIRQNAVHNAVIV